jgi:endonuclease YncB( thermonuclease family)
MWVRQLKRLTTCILLFLLGYSPALADFTDPVVGVLDGDTIEVLHNNYAERIRLNGIDCPEKGQARGKRAQQAASGLVYGKETTREIFG